MRSHTHTEALSVKGAVQKLQGIVKDLSSVTFAGEVVDVRRARGGAFATVADEVTTMQVFVPRHNLNYARGARLEEGQKVRLTAQWEVATASQRCTARVSFLQPLPGTGAIAQQKKGALTALETDGLLRRKFPGFRYTSWTEVRKLPKFSNVLLLTSSGSDGGADFKRKAGMMSQREALRERAVDLQGPGAASDLSAVLRGITPDEADLVCIVRGGGSWSDLRTFDDLGLARAIAQCAVPVMVAIGHERNISLADLVAEASFQTPSDAGARLDAAYRMQYSNDRRRSGPPKAEAGPFDGSGRVKSLQAEVAALRKELEVAGAAQSDQRHQLQDLLLQFRQLWQAAAGPLLDAAHQRMRRRTRLVAMVLWLAAGAVAVATLELPTEWPPSIDAAQLMWFGLVVALSGTGAAAWRSLLRLRRPPSRRALRRSPPAQGLVEWCDRVTRARRIRDLWVLTYYRPT